MAVVLPQTTESRIARIASLVEAACRQYGVQRLEIYGSAARADFDPERSDLDFAVDFGPAFPADPLLQFMEFRDALRQALGRPVDLSERHSRMKPWHLAAIEEDGVCVFEA